MLPERREAVLTAASDLFAQHGYKKTSIADIASAAGLSKSAIYLVEPSKTALYFRIVHDKMSRCIAESVAGIRVDAPAVDQLHDTLETQLRWIVSEPLVRALLVERTEMGGSAWTPRFDELRRLGRSTMTRLIELGMRQGAFRTDVDADTVALLLQDLQVSSLLLHDGDVDIRGDRWRTTEQLVVRGLAD